MRRRSQRPSSALALVCRSGPQCTMTVREGRNNMQVTKLEEQAKQQPALSVCSW